MDVRQLRYFVKIVDAGSFGKAALGLKLAQAALSEQMRKLEAELGVLLLVRHAGGVRPTEAGETLYGHALTILEQVRTAAEETRERATSIGGRVEFGMPAPLCVAFGPQILRETIARFPSIDLHLVEGRSVHLEEQLLQGSLDLAVLYEPTSTKLLLHEPIATEELVLIGPISDARLPDRLPSLDMLADFHVIVSTTVLGFVERAIRSQGLRMPSVIEVNSHPTMMRLVHESFGYCVLPEVSILEHERAGQFRACRLPQPLMGHRVVLSSPTGRPLSHATRALARHLGPLLRNSYRAAGLQVAI